jgi:hypothetical protein
VGDSDGQGVLRGELFQPGRGSEAIGVDPARVDVRRAGMTNKGDATLSLN